MHEFVHTVDSTEEFIRITDYLIGVFPAIPTKSAIKKAIKRGELFMDGHQVTTGSIVKTGQSIQYKPLPQSKKKVFKKNIEIVFEDDYLAIVNKPEGLGTSGNYFKTLENTLPFNLLKSAQEDKLNWPRPVHRLDRDTSGLVVVAKTSFALRKLHKQFEEHKVKKAYHALVHGEVLQSFKLDYPINDKDAESFFDPIRRYQLNNKQFTLLKANPTTGRTHQLLIHLMQSGKPIVGDELYGKKEVPFKHGGLYLSAIAVSL